MITSDGEAGVLANLKRKAAAAERMFASLVQLMGNELQIENSNQPTNQIQKPLWLQTSNT